MTRITSAEQVLMLLSAHLERTQHAGRKRAQGTKGRPGPLQRVQQLANVDGLSETDIARALIVGLLTEEFGAEFAAEPRFHNLVEEVRQIIECDERSRALLHKAIAQLTSASG